MTKYLLTTLSLIAGTYIASCAQATHKYSLKVAPWHELKVADGVNVDCISDPDRAGLIEFDTTEALASAITFEPSNKKLTIRLQSRQQDHQNLPTIRVYTAFITRATNEGDSTVRILSPASGPEMHVKVLGNGNLIVRSCEYTNIHAKQLAGHGRITLSGTATNASLKITGTGWIDASDLETTNTKINLTGTGTVNANVSGTMTVSGLGSGTIHYRGTPTISKKLISTVKLIPVI